MRPNIIYSWSFWPSSCVVMNDVLSSSHTVAVSSMLVYVLRRAERTRFFPFPGFFLGFFLVFMSCVRLFQSSLSLAWYSSTPPTSSVNSWSPAAEGVALAPLPPAALMLTGPPVPLIVLARLLPAIESALIVDEAGVALKRFLVALKPKAVLLLWNGSSSLSSLLKSLLRFSFRYSSISRKKSKINFLMISIYIIRDQSVIASQMHFDRISKTI